VVVSLVVVVVVGVEPDADAFTSVPLASSETPVSSANRVLDATRKLDFIGGFLGQMCKCRNERQKNTADAGSAVRRG
jgi:hypothetical protein